MIEFFPFSNKMETTEAEAMKDVMGLLETEPSESDHREQLAILVASGNCKEMLGFNLPKNKLRAPVRKNQTYRGKGGKFDFVHILMSDRLGYNQNHYIVFFGEISFYFKEKCK